MIPAISKRVYGKVDLQCEVTCSASSFCIRIKDDELTQNRYKQSLSSDRQHLILKPSDQGTKFHKSGRNSMPVFYINRRDTGLDYRDYAFNRVSVEAYVEAGIIYIKLPNLELYKLDKKRPTYAPTSRKKQKAKYEQLSVKLENDIAKSVSKVQDLIDARDKLETLLAEHGATARVDGGRIKITLNTEI